MARDSDQISKTWFRIRRFLRKLWVRAAGISLLALVAAASARLFGPLVPDEVAESLGGEALVRILQILASSMLAVTTFSLGIMVQARQAASAQVTPRSHRLLLQDTTTQTVLATFVGAFVFSLVSLIVVSTGFYGEGPTAVIMGFTLLVVALVVVTLLRWIEHLSDVGSVLEMSRRVEEAASGAMAVQRRDPCLGCNALTEASAAMKLQAAKVAADRTGHVQHVDCAALQKAAEAGGGSVYVTVRPGAFVAEGEQIAAFTGRSDPERLARAFTLGENRDYDQDPQFGVIVLCEIAQRALSPALNDSGTAIDIVGRIVRVLGAFRSDKQSGDSVAFPRVWIPPLSAWELVRDSLLPIARDGAAAVEVQVRLQQGLASLARLSDPEMREAAREASRRALERSDAALDSGDERRRVREAAPVDPA